MLESKVETDQLVKVWLELPAGATLTENDEGHIVSVTYPTVTPTIEEAPIDEGATVETEAESPSEPEAAQTPPEETPEPPADMPPATPAAVAHADELGVDLTQVEGSGADGKIIKADVVAAAESVDGDGATD